MTSVTRARRTVNRRQLDEALSLALSHEGPALVEVMADPLLV